MAFITWDESVEASKIVDILAKRGETIAVAESACGGLIASYLVSVPGASKVFVGGTTTYALKSRLRLSGWSQKDIDSYTGPSEAVAQRLARTLRVELGATYALGETGWASESTHPGCEPGKVYLSIAGLKDGVKSTDLSTGIVDKTANMEAFARHAVRFLRSILLELEAPRE